MSKGSVLSRHFRALAKKHGVKVKRWTKEEFEDEDYRGLGGMSDRDEKTVWVPEIRSRVSFTIAMHELGHVLGPWQHNGVLAMEAGAWKWAQENIPDWGKLEDRVMHKGMLSYYYSAMREHLEGRLKRPMKFPAKLHFFWKCLPKIPERPDWLSEDCGVVPWKDVMAHEQRPRCATCKHWQPHHKDDETEQEWGTCTSKARPMGVTPLVPDDALCGRSYQPNFE